METPASADRLIAVQDADPTQARIDALVGNLDAHPEITIERLAKAAGFTYQTWRNVVTGKSRRPATLKRFEQALQELIEHPEDIEEEPTHVVAPSPDDLIEVEISGDFGVRVVVRAPVADEGALRDFARELIREMRSKGED